MHELSICQSLLKQVQTIAMEQHAVTVDKIYLQVGPLSGVEPDLLKSAFPFAGAGTIAEQAQLVVITVPVKVHCNVCNSESQVSVNRLICAQCGDWHTQLLSGDELILERVELRTS